MAEPIKGEKFVLNETTTPRVTISADLVREHFAKDPETLAKLTSTTEVTAVKTTRISGEKKKFVMPNLANATPGGLVDMLGEVREEKKDLEKLEGIYKEAIAARQRMLEAEKDQNNKE